MSRDEIIERLVTHNHLDCCDCAAYRFRLTQQDDLALKRWYVLELGEWSPETEKRLRAGEVEALFEELLREEVMPPVA
mgnify:CR=1 FL=1